MSARPDTPLVRHLRTIHGQECAVLWQARPYVLLPGEGFARYIWEHYAALEQSMPVIERLPWPDVTFDYDTGRGLFTRQATEDSGLEPYLRAMGASAFVDRGRTWIRVVDLPTYLLQPAASPWLHGPVDLLAPFRAHPHDWMAIEAWDSQAMRPDAPRGFPPYPDVTLVQRLQPWAPAGLAHLYPNPECRAGRAYGAGFCHINRCQFALHDRRRLICMGSDLLMSTGVLLALLTLAYLEQSDEYLVEVRPVLTPNQTRAEAKAQAKRPELRRDVPHYILLDPLRAHSYGQPRSEREVRPAQGRTPPRPHVRRGHWRQLRSARYSADKRSRPTWVRPAWIGEEEWVSEGSRYKVVSPGIQACQSRTEHA